MKRSIRQPFFVINIKSYIYGQEALELAKVADQVAEKHDIDVMFTAQAVDLRMIRENTKNLILCAQFMDGIKPGRGMGYVLPDALVEAGVEAVILNHIEKPLTLYDLDKTLRCADDVGLLTIVCADTVEQCRAVAKLNPDMMICEPTNLIGTGETSNDDYITQTTAAVKEVNDGILVIQAAGVSTPEDVYRILIQGADGTGGTSGIVNAADRNGLVDAMVAAVKKAEGEKKQ